MRQGEDGTSSWEGQAEDENKTSLEEMGINAQKRHPAHILIPSCIYCSHLNIAKARGSDLPLWRWNDMMQKWWNLLMQQGDGYCLRNREMEISDAAEWRNRLMELGLWQWKSAFWADRAESPITQSRRRFGPVGLSYYDFNHNSWQIPHLTWWKGW